MGLGGSNPPASAKKFFKEFILKFMKKLNLAIVFGGKSAEHEISLISAFNIINAADKKKYKIISVGIDKDGEFLYFDKENYILNSRDPKKVRLGKNGKPVSFAFGKKKELIGLKDSKLRVKIDAVFPVLHGTFGEDGTMQGLLKMADVPFVGSGVLDSAIGMDKDVMKRLFRDAGIPTADFFAFSQNELGKINFEKLRKKLKLPFFVKPANLGSSVGISKVKNKGDFKKAIQEAFRFDSKIIIEECIKGREIECSVLGNESPAASVPGEIVPTHEFYSYEAKYLDENGAVLKIPARLSGKVIEKIRNLAVKSFRALCCEGMGRVDFFLDGKGKIYVNEINTIPGFTRISMYPKLWEESGLGYSELIDKLVELAIARYKREKKLQTSYID